MLKGLWKGRWREAKDPLQSALGDLERDVMEIVWQHGDTTVRRVQEALAKRVAYTTVMTTLDRLFKKGFVDRHRVHRAFVYRAVHTREQTEAAVASGMMAGLFSGPAAMPILSNLVDAVGRQADAAELLDALEAMVRDRRRQLEDDTELRARKKDRTT